MWAPGLGLRHSAYTKNTIIDQGPTYLKSDSSIYLVWPGQAQGLDISSQDVSVNPVLRTRVVRMLI